MPRPIQPELLSRRRILAAGCAAVAFGALASPPALARDSNQRGPRNRAGGDTPSGLPVPRYVSLRSDTVRGRAGPGEDYDVVTIYRREGLPVRVVAETPTWRRVEDPFGRQVWIAHYMLSGRLTAMVAAASGQAQALRRRPASDARTVALLQPGVVVEIDDRRDGWRKVKAGRYTGWLPVDALWGP